VAATCPSLVYLLVRRGRHLFIISSLLFLSFLFLSFLFYLATASVFSDRYSLHPLCLSIFTTHIYYYNSLFPPYPLSLKTPLLSSHIYTQTLHSLQDITLASRSSTTTRLTTVLTPATNLTPSSLDNQYYTKSRTTTMAPDLNSVPPSPRHERTAAAMPQSAPFKQPNILYIMADQLAAPLLKMHNPKSQIKTPNLDALAAGGVVFDSAYCPSPLCAPSRMSMVSGQLPTKIGSYDNACSIDPSVPTYAHYLRAAGYETTLAGKMHFIGEQLHGYESRLTSDIYPGDYGWAVNWEEPNRRLEWYHNASSIEQAGPCVRSNQLDYDEEVMYK